MADYIVDTNVWVAASGMTGAKDGDACMLACIEFMESLRQSGASIVIDIDDDPPGNSVMKELKRNLREGDYAHDLFWRHFFNRGLITPIPLEYDEEGAIIPDGIEINQVDPDTGKLTPFEPNDRKWIALYLTHGSTPPIQVAADSDWEKARKDLTKHGIKVRQLCTGDDI